MVIKDGMYVTIYHVNGVGDKKIVFEGVAAKHPDPKIFYLKGTKSFWIRDRSNPIISKCITMDILE
jgi:hypothetical protein